MTLNSLNVKSAGEKFAWSPESYRAETSAASPSWWLVLPLVLLIGIPTLARYNYPFFAAYMESELGVLEAIHAAFPLIAAAIGFRLLFHPTVRADKFLFAWITVMVLGCIYLGGEEASWGQHYFGWGTPELLSQLNDQQETNLHNMSSWLDQKPRGIVMAGMIIGGLVIPWLVLYRPGMLPRGFDIVYPPLALWPLALIILFFQFYGEIREFVLPHEWNRVRDGEFLETFMSLYLLYYALFLNWRVRQDS